MYIFTTNDILSFISSICVIAYRNTIICCSILLLVKPSSYPNQSILQKTSSLPVEAHRNPFITMINERKALSLNRLTKGCSFSKTFNIGKEL